MQTNRSLWPFSGFVLIISVILAGILYFPDILFAFSEDDLLFQYPVGEIPTKSYSPARQGPRQYGSITSDGVHTGIDLLERANHDYPETADIFTITNYVKDPLQIYASAYGEISYVAMSGTDRSHHFGNVVVIRHLLDNASVLYTTYGHMLNGSITVSEGDFVCKSQKIGVMGNTGYSDYPHIDFELKNDNGLGPVYGYIDSRETKNWRDENPDDWGYHNPYSFINQKKVLLPEFSLSGTSWGTYSTLYGYINKDITAAFSLYNNRTQDLEFSKIGVAGRGPKGKTDIRDLFMFDHAKGDNTLVRDGETRRFVGTNRFTVAGDYSFNVYIENVGSGYPILFSILENENSRIVDDDSSTGFETSIPADPKKILRTKGYGYGAYLINSEDPYWAKWSPSVNGKYRIEVYIPKGSTAEAHYGILPNGTQQSKIIAIVNQSDYPNGGWARLRDANGNEGWDFTESGFVDISGGGSAGQKLGFDAVKFEYISPDTQCVISTGKNAPNFQSFIDSYDRNGGQVSVGCAINSAHRWGKGWTQDFDGGTGGKGAIMLRDGTSIAYWVHGLIWDKYEDLRGATGFLAYPLTDELKGPPSSITGSENKYSDFEGGSIEHHASGPRAGLTVWLGHGIENKWETLGYGGGFLGLPISDEKDTAVSPYKTTGKVCDFEGGHIYWHENGSHKNQSFETHGAISSIYQSMGGTGSWLGFPISDEYVIPENGYPRSDFEGGYITAPDGINYYTYSYAQCPYTLTVKINPAGGGIVTKDLDKATYCLGEQIILNADASPGYKFSSWGGVTSKNGTTATVKIKNNQTVTASFTKSSETVSTPNTPTGPANGTTGATYGFFTGGASSSLNHPVQYQFDWKGNGTDLSPWGSDTQSKKWDNSGTYNVRARARCATHNLVISDWSLVLSVSIGIPTARISISAQGKTAYENQTLNLIVLQGQTANVSFSASRSSDPDGAISSYKWYINGTPVSTSREFNSNLAEGTYQIYLEVWDNLGAKGAVGAKIIIVQDHAPNPPSSSLSQFKSDGTTPIPTGGTTNEKIVVLKGSVSDPDGDQVKLQVELRNVTENFTGVITHESALVSSGSTASITVSNLTNGEYQWRGRAMDSNGDVSAWVEVGFSGADFIVQIGTPPPQGAINLPQTGQKACYDTQGNVINCSGTGQDGKIQAGVPWPQPRFTNPNGTTPITGSVVVDQLTGLMWTKDGKLSGGWRTWQEALDYVVGMNAGIYPNFGYTDWRLPNVNELESLVNSGVPNTATWLNGQGFINVQPEYYWSSTTYIPWTQGAATINMYEGSFDHYDKLTQWFAWPVRGTTTAPAQIWQTGLKRCFDTMGVEISCVGTRQDGNIQAGVSWPIPRFTTNADTTVTDNLTGLVWASDAGAPAFGTCAGGTKAWQEALDYVACLNTNGYLGFNGWRLPNRKELFSLFDHSQYNPALPVGHPFTNVQSIPYWSSTTYYNDAANPSNAWIYSLEGLGNGGTYKSNYFYVWPVRGGLAPATSFWPMFGHDAQHTGRSLTNGPQTNSVQWTFPADDSCYGWQYSPVVAQDGTVYVGAYSSTKGGSFLAIKKNGSLKWSYNFGNTTAMEGTPAILSDGSVCFATSGGTLENGALYCLNSDGTLKWAIGGLQLQNVSAGLTVGRDDTIYLSDTIGERLLSIDAKGTINWVQSLGARTWSSPAIGYDGTIYVAQDDHKLFAFNPDGSIKWEKQLITGLSSIYMTSPAIGGDGTIYIADYNKFFAINPDGSTKWVVEAELSGQYFSYNSPVIGPDETIYIAASLYPADSSQLYAIGSDGSVRWKHNTQGYSFSSTPAIGADGTIYFAVSWNPGTGSVLSLNPDGTLKWKYDINAYIYISPCLSSEGTLYIGPICGFLYAFGPP